ncbi:unnamed protein product [Urochloa humidicola]
MALFAVDPRPFVPVGFEWQPRIAPREPRRMRVFLGPSGVKANENMAIAITEPRIDPADFHIMANSLQEFLQQEHQVRELEIWRCPIGEAYVRFSCPLERTRFLRQPLQFGQYQLRFVKHDEGCNARLMDMDREAWLMLLAYPADYRSDEEIDKALSGFAILKHVHRSSNVARLIVKVKINREEDVPDEIVVSPGDSPRAPSWTVPVYILYACGPTLLADEDALPPDGSLHPLPHPAPHWMGGPGHDVGAQNPHQEEASVGNQPGASSAAERQGQDDPMEEDQQIQSPLSAAASVGNANDAQAGDGHSPLSGAAADFAASGGLKSPVVPAPSVPLKVVQDEASEEPRVIEQLSDVEVLDKMPARRTPKKRRAKRARGPLGVGLLRMSLRLKKAHGFKDDASASATAAASAEDRTAPGEQEFVDDHTPLEVVPANPVVGSEEEPPAAVVPYKPALVDPDAPMAPHLSPVLMQAIGSEFLKMPPGGASVEMLRNLPDVD